MPFCPYLGDHSRDSKNFLKLRISNFPFIRYKRCNFGRGRSKAKASLLEKKSAFSYVSQLLFVGFS